MRNVCKEPHIYTKLTMENLRKQINNLTKAIMKNEHNVFMFVSLYEILTKIQVPSEINTLFYNTHVFTYNGMYEEALESLNEVKKEINKKPSIADLKNIQKHVMGIIDSIDNDEINVHYYNLSVARYRITYNFEIALLLSNDCWETINNNIEKSISMAYLHMFNKRLIDESATCDSIGDLYNLPFDCLMAIASA
jgi:tetratricopeptide (TPR) repeat protein